MPYDIGHIDGGEDRTRRLLALADYLDTVSDQHYDHRTWRRLRADGSWAMCALGHAVTALPHVVGLRWREPDSAEIVRLDGSGVTEHALTLAAEAFGLTIEEANMIFGVGLYTVAFYGPSAVFRAKPRTVASAIRKYALLKLARNRAHAISIA
jgi:hypothetical protein